MKQPGKHLTFQGILLFKVFFQYTCS